MRISLYICSFIAVLCAPICVPVAVAQLSVTPGGTAASLAATLSGPGITISSPMLTCAPAASGTFTVSPGTVLGTGTTLFGINSGIILTSGKAVNAAGTESFLASTNTGTTGDAALVTLAGATTYDACVLEFDLTPVGDTIKFNYQFGSEEYNNSTCGPYNDAFAFFISGPGITGIANMALVPGTTIPVTVNSVNNGVPGPGYTLANCTAMGPGSPFTTYYVDNTGGSSFSYKGYTSLLTARQSVMPCNTYHLKLAIADAGNHLYDSGVFIEAGSLTTPVITGTTSICAGGTLSLSYATAGGTWSSSDVSVATVGSSSGVVTGVSAGTVIISYNITSTCFLATTITVNSLSPITGMSKVCEGATITLANAVSGGTWTTSNPAVTSVASSTGVVSGISAGTAMITYTTGSGCFVTYKVTVDPSPAPITGTTTICAGAQTTLSNITGGGTWAGDNGAVASVTSSTGIVSGLSAGTVNVSYTVAGCYTTKTVTVAAIPPAIAGPSIVCVSNTATLSNTAGGGVWSTASTANISIDAASGVITGIAPGTATVTYTTVEGCQTTSPITINVNPASISLTATDTVSCVGTYSTFTALDSNKVIKSASYTWSFDAMPISSVNPVSHAFDVAGTHTVTFTFGTSGCPSASISREVISMKRPDIDLGADTGICPGSEALRLRDRNDHANEAITWRWSNGQATAYMDVVSPGVYCVTATLNGCTSIDSITVLNDCYMNIPNAFTPNNDGINDYFFPRSYLTRGLTTFNMSIYNRWGAVVFETTATDGRGWDGALNGVPQPQGVYVYVIDATFKDGQKEKRQGNVTLLK